MVVASVTPGNKEMKGIYKQVMDWAYKKNEDMGKLEQFPPPLVRCLARKKARGKAVRALSDQEVAIQSEGLTTLEVRAVSNSLSWDSIAIGICTKVLQGL